MTREDYIGYCNKAEFCGARALGLLALEMMQKCVLPSHLDEDSKITLKSPELWSAQAANFLEVTSFCSLNEIKMARNVSIITRSISNRYVIEYLPKACIHHGHDSFCELYSVRSRCASNPEGTAFCGQSDSRWLSGDR